MLNKTVPESIFLLDVAVCLFLEAMGDLLKKKILRHQCGLQNVGSSTARCSGSGNLAHYCDSMVANAGSR